VTVGEARGFVKIIENYPHLSNFDRWASDQEAIEIEPAQGHVPMMVTIRNGDLDRATGHRPSDCWQILRNGSICQLTRGDKVLV
jgi:hypothetical protein